MAQQERASWSKLLQQHYTKKPLRQSATDMNSTDLDQTVGEHEHGKCRLESVMEDVGLSRQNMFKLHQISREAMKCYQLLAMQINFTLRLHYNYYSITKTNTERLNR